MKWLTTDYIQAEAKKGRRPALECSIEHWEQLAGATWRELVAGGAHGQVNMGKSHCALCVRYIGIYDHSKGDKCGPCPLTKAKQNCFETSSQFKAVKRAKEALGFEYMDELKCPAFHREAKKMVKVLKDVHKKLYRTKP